MIYICIRTYGNGKHINKVYNLYFEWLSQAERVAELLNKTDAETGDRWLCVPLNKFVGKVWEETNDS